jgi:hypothetical protein
MNVVNNFCQVWGAATETYSSSYHWTNKVNLERDLIKIDPLFLEVSLYSRNHILITIRYVWRSIIYAKSYLIICFSYHWTKKVNLKRCLNKINLLYLVVSYFREVIFKNIRLFFTPGAMKAIRCSWLTVFNHGCDIINIASEHNTSGERVLRVTLLVLPSDPMAEGVSNFLITSVGFYPWRGLIKN